MKKLVKIRLINWHMFYDRTIEIKGNTLLTGENGSGKSTLLDAIQYVLTGGKAKFNVAANENAKRKLEGYIRGKLGVEGKEYLRNGDVTTHIALEYHNEENDSYFVIGCVLDLPSGGKERPHFYMLDDTKIIDSLYIDDKRKPYSYKAFLGMLKTKSIKHFVYDSQKEAGGAFMDALGLSRKYHDLLPKALAFKPIDTLHKFIYDFLLNDDKINLNNLKDNIHRYRDLEKILDEQKKKLVVLNELYTHKETYDNHQLDKRVRLFMKDIIEMNRMKEKYEDLIKNQARLNNEQNSLDTKISNIFSELKRVEQECTDLLLNLNQNESYTHQQHLQKSKIDVEILFERAKKDLNSFYNAYIKEIAFLESLRMSHGLLEDKKDVINDEELTGKLYDLSNRLKDKKESMNRKKYDLEYEITKLSDQLKEINNEIRSLENRRFQYSRQVTDLIKLLNEELKKVAKEHIDIRPLCEYLEVRDEKWRNAIEGYLNTQRFDIIVDSKYFSYASKLYEQYKDEHGIYGVGIVDVAKLEKYSETVEGSLASMITTSNMYARCYANMLMNRVVLEENVENLRNHNIAITPSCMIYQNYTVRAMNPAIYNRPFIGQKAIALQLETRNKERVIIEDDLKKKRRLLDDCYRALKILNDSNMDELSRSSEKTIYEYKDTSNRLSSIKDELKRIKKDSSLLLLEETYEKKLEEKKLKEDQYVVLKVKHENTKNELNNTINEINSLDSTIESIEERKVLLEEENVDILHEADHMYELLYKKTSGNFDRMRDQNNTRIENLEKELHTIEMRMIDVMHRFNLQTSMGLGETINELPLYLDIYERIRNIEIEEVKYKAEMARKKCEDSFQEDFISTLRNKFNKAKEDIKKLNKALEKRIFAKERYEFTMGPSKDPIFAQYYSIIMSGEEFTRESLFVETLSDNNRLVMMELFDRIALSESDSKNEKLLSDYTDYRQYMSYDIKIHHDDGTYSLFSKVNREKSGGETQTPYYVTIAASFEQLLNYKRYHESCGCLVLFDEAFNNMDETRIEEMMKFYNDLNIQLIIAVPPGRIQTITPYVETTLTLIKNKNQIYVREFMYEG